MWRVNRTLSGSNRRRAAAGRTWTAPSVSWQSADSQLFVRRWRKKRTDWFPVRKPAELFDGRRYWWNHTVHATVTPKHTYSTDLCHFQPDKRLTWILVTSVRSESVSRIFSGFNPRREDSERSAHDSPFRATNCCFSGVSVDWITWRTRWSQKTF